MGLDEIAEASIARYGTASAPAPARPLRAGELSLRIDEGAARSIAFGGVEVLRGIAYPVRDADWATAPELTLAEHAEQDDRRLRYERQFAVGGDFDGWFRLDAETTPRGARLTAQLRLEARHEVRVNRAGFVLLHPLTGLVGQPLRVRRPDGSEDGAAFPTRISPGQPVFNIAGLSHEVTGVAVDIAFSGEVFEMEDQRNWTDASFKTYCRPLSLPRPFELKTGERVEQRVEVRLERRAEGAGPATPSPAQTGRLPRMVVALDEQVAALNESSIAPIKCVNFTEALVRLRPKDADAALASASRLDLPLALEIVVPKGVDPKAELRVVAKACHGASAAPVRVLALPEPYLASHQPEGPWPDGATPEDAADAVRAAFPAARAGAGMLTNFTEFNRRPPHHESDYVSFGTTAIVHAADDVSVLETLEAMPDIFDSARDLAGGRPLRLGTHGDRHAVESLRRQRGAEP